MLDSMNKHKDWMYVVFRVLVGLVFFMHGAQKMFGWFGGGKVANLATLFGAAGIVEVVVGLLLIFGLWSGLMAAFGAVEMLVALITMHFPQGWNPLQNGGEAAVLYFAAFLVILSHGSGRWSLEGALKRK